VSRISRQCGILNIFQPYRPPRPVTGLASSFRGAKKDLLEIGLSVVDWIGLAQDRYRWRALVNSVMNLRVPYNAGYLPSGCTTCGLSSGTQLHRDSYLGGLN
jgi:hypothetical protein